MATTKTHKARRETFAAFQERLRLQSKSKPSAVSTEERERREHLSRSLMQALALDEAAAEEEQLARDMGVDDETYCGGR